MRYFLFLIIFISINQLGNAQNPSGFDFFAGYGFYQGYTIGSGYNLKPANKYIRLSISYDKLAKRNQENTSLALGYNFAVFKKLKNDSEEFKWQINNNMIL